MAATGNSMQSYLSFDPTITSGSNITGTYTNTKFIKSNYFIPVSQIELERYRKRPNAFRIDNDKIVEIVKDVEHVKLSQLSKERFVAKHQILQSIEVNGREYTPDLPFQTNLALALCLAHHTEAMPKFWCKQEGEWIFIEHSLQELLAISEEINRRREEISARLYSELE